MTVVDPLDDTIGRGGVPRDRWGRALLVPPGGGDRVPYTSVSTLASQLNAYVKALHEWEMVKAVQGVAMSRELTAIAGSSKYSTRIGDDDTSRNREEKKIMMEVIEQGKLLSGAHEKAMWGTAFHRFVEDPDPLGEPPEDMAEDIEAFREALKLAGITILATEVFVVNEALGAAGSFDYALHVPWRPGKVVIGDSKGLPLDTPLPTTTGWTTMGEVRAGDELLGRDGLPARVLDKSSIHHKPCVRITFDDGTSMVCDVEHRWPVRRKPRRHKYVEPVEVLEASDLEPGMRIDMPEPLKLPAIELPIDPWALGVWLGDGKHTSNEVTSADRFIWEEAERCGYPNRPNRSTEGPKTETRSLRGLRKGLRELGLLGNKHIPALYLRASREQREALVQGLMDTDGYWNDRRGQACITQTNEVLARQLHELLLSLGQRAVLRPIHYSGFGKTGTTWLITFTPRAGLIPFRMPRKAERVSVPSTAVADRRLIKRVEPVEMVPTQCITVDSGDETYLCGRDMLVTHNTGKLKPDQCEIQLYGYADSVIYDRDTDKRIPFEEAFGMPADLEVGYIPHTPPMSKLTELWPVDLVEGKKAAILARDVHRRNAEARKRYGKKVWQPIDVQEIARSRAREEITRASWGDPTPIELKAALSAIHKQYRAVWTTELTELGRELLAAMS